jgi:hypothetical protein
MKGIVFSVLLILAVNWCAAEGAGNPNFFYKPASIGMILPEDTVQSEEDEVTYYESGSTKVKVMIYEADKAFQNADILDNQKFEAAIGEEGASDVKPYTSCPEGDIVFNSATGMMEYDEGNMEPAYLFILNSKAANGKSFIICVFTPEIVNDSNDPAFIAADSISFAEAGK